MTTPDAPRIDQVLRECGEVPVDGADTELAAIAVAVHLEEALALTVPAELLHPEHLVPPAALERTVTRLMGGS